MQTTFESPIINTKVDLNEQICVQKKDESAKCILTDEDKSDVNKGKSEADEGPQPGAPSLMVNTVPPASLMVPPEASLSCSTHTRDNSQIHNSH